MFEGNYNKWVKQALFGGKGEVSVQDLLGAAAMPPFAAVLACELTPLGSVGQHHQTEADEIVVCLAGQGRVTVAGEARDFLPGAVAYVPLGKLLAIENLSPTDALRYFIIKAAKVTPP